MNKRKVKAVVQSMLNLGQYAEHLDAVSHRPDVVMKMRQSTAEKERYAIAFATGEPVFIRTSCHLCLEPLSGKVWRLYMRYMGRRPSERYPEGKRPRDWRAVSCFDVRACRERHQQKIEQASRCLGNH